MEFDKVQFGKRLGKLRRAKGLSQEQLAADIFSSRSHISHMEIGKDAPSVDFLVNASAFFQVSLDFLVFGKQEKNLENEREKLEEAKRLLESIDLE